MKKLTILLTLITSFSVFSKTKILKQPNIVERGNDLITMTLEAKTVESYYRAIGFIPSFPETRAENQAEEDVLEELKGLCIKNLGANALIRDHKISIVDTDSTLFTGQGFPRDQVTVKTISEAECFLN